MLCAAPIDFAVLTNYEWAINGQTVYGNMIPVTFPHPGTYTVKVRAIYIDIEAESEMTVTVRPRQVEDDPPPANKLPTVTINADRTSGKPKNKKLVIISLAANAADEDGRIVSYLWRFDDGSTSTDPMATRTYGKKDRGTHIERVTVTDDKGAQASAEIVITIR